jgi:hypothetical protein
MTGDFSRLTRPDLGSASILGSRHVSTVKDAHTTDTSHRADKPP